MTEKIEPKAKVSESKRLEVTGRAIFRGKVKSEDLDTLNSGGLMRGVFPEVLEVVDEEGKVVEKKYLTGEPGEEFYARSLDDLFAD